jgi:hypothetical protein
MSKRVHAAKPMTAEELVDLASDPVDTLRLIADLVAMTNYRTLRVAARRVGLPSPRVPKPRSRRLRAFTASLKAKLRAIAEEFGPDEIERLKRLGPAVSERLDSKDPQVEEQVCSLLFMTPPDAVTWIREHVGELETRFAS